MNKRFYQIFKNYIEKIRKYPVKINYVLITEHTKTNFNMEYHTVKIQNEVDLEEKLYELCDNNEVYFPHEAEELTTKILKYKGK